MAKKVFVNGYGSIGKRIAAFISEDPEIDLIGVGKYSNDAGVSDAKSKGHIETFVLIDALLLHL